MFNSLNLIDGLSHIPSAIINRLESAFPLPESSQGSLYDFPEPYSAQGAYDPALRPLYKHFLTALYSICSPFTTDPVELAYIAAARWPGFVEPVLDEHRRRVNEHRENRAKKTPDAEDHVDDSEQEELLQEGPPELQPPSEDVRMRLTRLFTPSLTAALEALYPRLTFAGAWAQANTLDANLLSVPPRDLTSLPIRMPEDQGSQHALRTLPRMAKFILVASFIASTNSAKTDMRMFGRGPDERAKRRRRGGSPRKGTGKNAAVKVRASISSRRRLRVL